MEVAARPPTRHERLDALARAYLGAPLGSRRRDRAELRLALALRHCERPIRVGWARLWYDPIPGLIRVTSWEGRAA